MRKISLMVFVLFASAAALAMTCESSAVVQRTTVDAWAPVFVGRVTLLYGNVTREADGREYGYKAELQIEKRFWGVPKEVPERIRVVGLASPLRWYLDGEYLVVGMTEILEEEDGWTVVVDSCSATRLLNDSRVGLRTMVKGFCDKPGGTIVAQLWARDGSTRSPLKNVQVRISDGKGKVTTTTTDDDGIYAVHHLPMGAYRINTQIPASLTLAQFQITGSEVREAGECVDGSQEFESTKASPGNSQ
ncbi:MAG TPA: SdrD B-like domain-containing protein [Candidatus Koribacter sp.]|jgi:hypothetical protein